MILLPEWVISFLWDIQSNAVSRLVQVHRYILVCIKLPLVLDPLSADPSVEEVKRRLGLVVWHLPHVSTVARRYRKGKRGMKLTMWPAAWMRMKVKLPDDLTEPVLVLLSDWSVRSSIGALA